jgi:putative membrane protein insertion efficiency factor
MTTDREKKRLTGVIAAVPIRLYQLVLSPLLGRNCRFSPSCSSYAIEALGRFGIVRGGILAVRRLGRCHPFGSSGFDPVPTRWGS